MRKTAVARFPIRGFCNGIDLIGHDREAKFRLMEKGGPKPPSITYTYAAAVASSLVMVEGASFFTRKLAR